MWDFQPKINDQTKQFYDIRKNFQRMQLQQNLIEIFTRDFTNHEYVKRDDRRYIQNILVSPVETKLIDKYMNYVVTISARCILLLYIFFFYFILLYHQLFVRSSLANMRPRSTLFYQCRHVTNILQSIKYQKYY